MGGGVEGCSWAEGEIESEGMWFGRGRGECVLRGGGCIYGIGIFNVVWR